MTPGHAVLDLQVQGREHMAVDDGSPNVRRVLGQDIDHAIGEPFPLLAPAHPAVQAVGRVLHEDRHDVPARRCEIGVVGRGDRDLQQGISRRSSVLRIVVGALDVLDARCDVRRPLMLGPEAGAG